LEVKRVGHCLSQQKQAKYIHSDSTTGEKWLSFPNFRGKKNSLILSIRVSHSDLVADFITLPPLFKFEQLYELEYQYKVEGKGRVKFALATDGNLWIWNHKIAGLTALVYYFFPVMGFLVGSAVAMFIKGVNWHKGLDRLNQQEIR